MAFLEGVPVMIKRSSWSGARRLVSAATLLAFSIIGPAALLGQTEKKGLFAPWEAKAEVSYVVTGGNTSTSALSLGTTFSRKWTRDTLLFKSYILTSNSTTTTRTAQGTETDFSIIETKTTRKVAENYVLAGQYDRKISNGLAGQIGLSWDRNRFAGVENRVTLTGGLGYNVVAKPRTQIKTSAGLTYTRRQYVGQDYESFAGLRFTLSGEQKILDNSSVTTAFIFDDNLKSGPDWRFDWANSVTASISRSLALKVSLRTLYAHLPALQSLPLFDDLGQNTGLTVPYPLKKLDAFLTTSIVINF
jgi:putative salt-induced outer membrane protein YdiY